MLLWRFHFFVILANSIFQHMHLFVNICTCFSTYALMLCKQTLPHTRSSPLRGLLRRTGDIGHAHGEGTERPPPLTLRVGSNPPRHRHWEGDRELLGEAGDSPM